MSQVAVAEVHEAVRDFYAREMPEHSARLQAIGADESLFELGLLDSLSFLGLIEFIEGRFGIVVPPGDFAQARWKTLNLMAAYVVKAMESPR